MDEYSAIGQFLYEEIGIVKDLAFIWPSRNKKMIAYSVVYFTTLIYFAISFSVSFFFLMDDMHELFLNVNFLLLLQVTASIPFYFRRSRKVQFPMFLMVMEEFIRYKIEFPSAVSRATRLKVKKQLYVYIIVLAVSLVSGCIIVFSSTIDSYFGDVQNKTSDFITYNLPIHVWVPFQLHHSFWGTIVVMVGEVLFIFFLVLTLLASALIFVKLNQKLFYEQEILIWSLKNITKRAMEGQELSEDNSTLEFWLDFSLTENIKHHQHTKRFIALFSQVAAPMLMAAWCLGTTSIILSVYEAVQGNVLPGKILATAGLAASDALNLFVLSRMGQHLLDLQEEIHREVCFLPWYNFSMPTRRNFLIFLSGTLKPTFVKAGSIIPISYDSYATAMNTAYSYFNLLNAAKIK